MPSARGTNGYARLWQVLVIMGTLASAIFTAQAYVNAGHERTVDRELKYTRERHNSDIQGLKEAVNEIRCDVKQLLKAQWKEGK